MAITQTITSLGTVPTTADPTNFDTNADTFLGTALPLFRTELDTFGTQANTLAASLNALAAGTAMAIPYTFSTTTTDSDPGAGILRLDNATQASATAIRVDLLGSDTTDYTAIIDDFDSSTNTITGQIRLVKASDPTKWLVFNVTAVDASSGYRNITVTNVDSSGVDPFSDADDLILMFTRTGDVGATGATGAAGAAGTGAIISNIVVATTATTLTSTRTLLQITPTSYGVRVTLPDATALTASTIYHVVDNRGAYPVLLCDNDGTLIGFVYGGTVCEIGLNVAGSAAGSWSGTNLEKVGASAQLLSAVLNYDLLVTAIDADRDLILGWGPGAAYLYGVIWDKAAGAFGTVTAIRSVAMAGRKYGVIKSATDQALVVSCNSTTGFEAVVLTISGTGITVNTPDTATLSANISSFADGCELIQVGTSFITSYSVSGPSCEIREITISGTTPTISAATVLDGTAGGLIVAGDSTHVIAVSTTTTNLYTKPYTIGGLSAGTGTTTASGGTNWQSSTIKIGVLGTRWGMVANYGAATDIGFIISLSGTTTTVTTATLFSAGTLTDAIVISSTTMLVLNNQASNNANILTDSSGTASAGTAITLDSNTARNCLYVDGTDVAVQSGTTAFKVNIVDCSGASPVLTKTLSSNGGTWSNAQVGYFAQNGGSDARLNKPKNGLYGTAFAQTVTLAGATTQIYQSRIDGGEYSTIPVRSYGYAGDTAYRGASDSERWVTDAATVITKVECVA